MRVRSDGTRTSFRSHTPKIVVELSYKDAEFIVTDKSSDKDGFWQDLTQELWKILEEAGYYDATE